MSNSQFVKRVEAAAEETAWNVAAIARQYETPIIIWADGATIEIDAFTKRRIRPATFDEGKTELSGDSPLEVV